VSVSLGFLGRFVGNSRFVGSLSVVKGKVPTKVPDHIKSRALEVAVPPGRGTPAQQKALQDLVEYGKQNGVTVKIIEIE
jgi:hypothetical protein